MAMTISIFTIIFANITISFTVGIRKVFKSLQWDLNYIPKAHPYLSFSLESKFTFNKKVLTFVISLTLFVFISFVFYITTPYGLNVEFLIERLKFINLTISTPSVTFKQCLATLQTLLSNEEILFNLLELIVTLFSYLMIFIISLVSDYSSSSNYPLPFSGFHTLFALKISEGNSSGDEKGLSEKEENLDENNKYENKGENENDDNDEQKYKEKHQDIGKQKQEQDQKSQDKGEDVSDENDTNIINPNILESYETESETEVKPKLDKGKGRMIDLEYPRDEESSYNPYRDEQSSYNPYGGGQSSYNPYGGGQSSYNPYGESSSNPHGESSSNPYRGGESSRNPFSSGSRNDSVFDPESEEEVWKKKQEAHDRRMAEMLQSSFYPEYQQQDEQKNEEEMWKKKQEAHDYEIAEKMQAKYYSEFKQEIQENFDRELYAKELSVDRELSDESSYYSTDIHSDDDEITANKKLDSQELTKELQRTRPRPISSAPQIAETLETPEIVEQEKRKRDASSDLDSDSNTRNKRNK